MFDTNGDQTLDAAELRQAFACVVRTGPALQYHLTVIPLCSNACFVDLVIACLSLLKQGKDLSEPELLGIIETHDLDHNGVFDEVASVLL